MCLGQLSLGKMLIPKKNLKAVYEHLFKEGVMVAKKDFNLPKHSEIDVPNLQVIKALQSLKSRGYVKEQFSWRWYYWYLTNDGILYLRDYLHLPQEIVPATLKRPVRTETAKPRPRESDRPSREDRDEREMHIEELKNLEIRRLDPELILIHNFVKDMDVEVPNHSCHEEEQIVVFLIHAINNITTLLSLIHISEPTRPY